MIDLPAKKSSAESFAEKENSVISKLLNNGSVDYKIEPLDTHKKFLDGSWARWYPANLAWVAH